MSPLLFIIFLFERTLHVEKGLPMLNGTFGTWNVHIFILIFNSETLSKID